MGGGLAETMCGAAVVILAILALTNFWPITLAAIALILFGVAMLCDGGALVATVTRIFDSRTAEHHHVDAVGWGGGMAAEVVGACCGIVLGVLALFSVNPLTLCAVAVLVFGGVLLASGAARNQMESLVEEEFATGDRFLIREAGHGAAALEMLAGGAVVILGILAIVWSHSSAAISLDLTLVALLCLGAASVVSGLAFSGRSIRMISH